MGISLTLRLECCPEDCSKKKAGIQPRWFTAHLGLPPAVNQPRRKHRSGFVSCQTSPPCYERDWHEWRTCPYLRGCLRQWTRPPQQPCVTSLWQCSASRDFCI